MFFVCPLIIKQYMCHRCSSTTDRISGDTDAPFCSQCNPWLSHILNASSRISVFDDTFCLEDSDFKGPEDMHATAFTHLGVYL